MVDSNVIIAQMTLVEGLGIAIIGGIFGVVMKWQDAKHERERQKDRDRADELRKQDLEYREERERIEAEREAEMEAKEKARKELDTARLNLSFASVNGLMVLLHAAHGDQVNGNVDKAIESIEHAKGECNKLTNKNAIEHVS